eukprot:g63187.t1
MDVMLSRCASVLAQPLQVKLGRLLVYLTTVTTGRKCCGLFAWLYLIMGRSLRTILVVLFLGLSCTDASLSLSTTARRAPQQNKDLCDPSLSTQPAVAHCASCPNCTVSELCSGTACEICASGFFLGDDGVCSSCPPQCAVCSDGRSCARCDAGSFFFATPTPACRGSAETCGSEAPKPFQPLISGGFGFTGAGVAMFAIKAEFSNHYYNARMHFRTCNKTTVLGPTVTTDYCNGIYTAVADYMTDCKFKLQESETTYLYRGTLDIEVNYDQYFLGVLFAEPGYLKRPVAWKLTLNKLLSTDVNLEMKNSHQCEGPFSNLDGVKTQSLACHGQGCELQGAGYLQCVCDACHTGPFCQTDTCAPSPVCPSGLLTIALAAGETRANGTLNRLASQLAFLPSAVDKTLSGWSDVAPNQITTTRKIGSAAETVVQVGGVNTDNLLTMVWGEDLYQLDTAYVVSYSFDDTLGGPLAYCNFSVQITSQVPLQAPVSGSSMDSMADYAPPTITCPTSVLDNVGNKLSSAAAATSAYLRHKRIPDPEDVTTIVDWPDAVVSDSNGQVGTITTYEPLRNSDFAPGSHTVTATATDLSGNQANCSFELTVWKPYPRFVVAEASVVISRIVITESATTGKEQSLKKQVADVRYVTQVKWPYMFHLPQPSDLSNEITEYEEDISLRSCPGSEDVVEAPDAVCTQHWRLTVELGACPSASVSTELPHHAACSPVDCAYQRFPATLSLGLSADNLCETEVATGDVTVELFLLSDGDYLDWIFTNHEAHPVSLPNVTGGSQVNAVVRAQAEGAELIRVEIVAATRRTYTGESVQALTLSSQEQLIVNGSVSATTAFEVHPNFVSGTNYAVFKYVEQTSLASEYVTLTVTVLLQYELNLGAGRRRFLEVDVEVVGSARRQLLQDATHTVADASVALTVQCAAGACLSSALQADSATAFWTSAAGTAVIVMIVAGVALSAICILLAVRRKPHMMPTSLSPLVQTRTPAAHRKFLDSISKQLDPEGAEGGPHVHITGFTPLASWRSATHRRVGLSVNDYPETPAGRNTLSPPRHARTASSPALIARSLNNHQTEDDHAPALSVAADDLPDNLHAGAPARKVSSPGHRRAISSPQGDLVKFFTPGSVSARRVPRSLRQSYTGAPSGLGLELQREGSLVREDQVPSWDSLVPVAEAKDLDGITASLPPVVKMQRWASLPSSLPSPREGGPSFAAPARPASLSSAIRRLRAPKAPAAPSGPQATNSNSYPVPARPATVSVLPRRLLRIGASRASKTPNRTPNKTPNETPSRTPNMTPSKSPVHTRTSAAPSGSSSNSHGTSTADVAYLSATRAKASSHGLPIATSTSNSLRSSPSSQHEQSDASQSLLASAWMGVRRLGYQLRSRTPQAPRRSTAEAKGCVSSALEPGPRDSQQDRSSIIELKKYGFSYDVRSNPTQPKQQQQHDVRNNPTQPKQQQQQQQACLHRRVESLVSEADEQAVAGLLEQAIPDNATQKKVERDMSAAVSVATEMADAHVMSPHTRSHNSNSRN